MGRKLGEAVPLWGGGGGSPSNTVWQGPRPTCTPSFILIRQTVWPQCTIVTDRTEQTGQTNRQTDRTDSSPIASGEPFYKRRAQLTASVLQCCCKVNNTTGAKYKYNTDLIRMKFSTICLIYTYMVTVNNATNFRHLTIRTVR